MSSIAAGVASSVTGAAQQARQVGAARDKHRVDGQRAADHDADQFIQKLEASHAADDPDAELPDRQAPGYEQLYLCDPDGEPLGRPGPPTADTYEARPDGSLVPPGYPLYQHLDVTA